MIVKISEWSDILDITPAKYRTSQYTHTFKVSRVDRNIYKYKRMIGKGFVHMPKMLGSYTSEDYDIIVVEKVDGEHVERLPTTRQVTLYAYKLLRVLEVLHALNFAHGDIKPSNILYNRYNRSPQDLSNIKLIDFGFAQVFDEPCKTGIRGYSYGYSSLELVNTNSIILKDDIYSAGIIIGQLICGYTARDFEAHGEITERVQQSRLPFGTEPLGSFVLQMLAPRQERLAASQLLEHQAFKELLDSPFSSDEEMKLD